MINSVLIEVRPLLRACNVCITLKETSTDNLKINIQKNSITLNESTTVNFPDFEFEPLTMTGLNLKNKYVTFRVQINGEFERFEKETAGAPAPFLENNPYKIKCKCGNVLADDIVFNRVLPLPSSNWDASDAFCHADDFSPSVTPRPRDCLYGSNFIVISDELLPLIKNGRKIVKCERCLGVLGTHEKDFFKFWNVGIVLPFEDLTPLEEFFKLIRNAVSESLSIFTKLLIECREIDNYLMMCVMDKRLLLYESGDGLVLKKSNVLKLSYTYQTFKNGDVKKWEGETFVQHLEVSEKVLRCGFEFLVNTSRKIPPMFNMVNGEFLAYL